MDLELDKGLKKQTKINDEVNLFIKELSNSLKQKTTNNFQTTICNEIYNNVALANKYKNQIETLVNNYMVEMSYKKDFLYYDYDSKQDIYYFDYYSNGEKTQIEIPEDEVKIMGNRIGTFWELYDNEKIVEAKYIGDSLKINVSDDLQNLENELKNK